MSRSALIMAPPIGFAGFAGAAITGLAMWWLAYPSTASAQRLDDRDYEACSFYDRADRIIDYDQDCLERRRDIYRRRQGRRGNIYRGNALCPWHANGGQGYNATFYLDGRNANLFGTWDAAFDGRPCVPRGQPFTRGYP